jgi:hypothetical protein
VRKDIAERWADRLESGEVEQTRGRLGAPGKQRGRCCLGVLCDIAVEDGVIDAPRATVDGYMSYDASTLCLPGSVMAWADMRSDNGDLKNEWQTLAQMNDDGVSFVDIALTIKHNVEKL